MLEILFLALLGCLLGTITGLTPGLHVNTIAIIGFSLFPSLSISPLEFALVMVSMAVTHTFLDFIPAIFLGVPEEETALSVLPTHQLLLQGKALEAIQLTAIGSLLGLGFSLTLVLPALFVIPVAYQFLRPFIVYILLKRLYRDAVRFIEREHEEEEKHHAHTRFQRRLSRIAVEQYEDRDCQRLGKRLRKYREDMFRFVVVEGLDPNNNAAERGIRPNVVKRKISGGNRSNKGAVAHAVNMSIIETCKRQDLNFFEFGMEYLQDQITLGSDDKLPNCK